MNDICFCNPCTCPPESACVPAAPSPAMEAAKSCPCGDNCACVDCDCRTTMV